MKVKILKEEFIFHKFVQENVFECKESRFEVYDEDGDVGTSYSYESYVV